MSVARPTVAAVTHQIGEDRVVDLPVTVRAYDAQLTVEYAPDFAHEAGDRVELEMFEEMPAVDVPGRFVAERESENIGAHIWFDTRPCVDVDPGGRGAQIPDPQVQLQVSTTTGATAFDARVSVAGAVAPRAEPDVAAYIG